MNWSRDHNDDLPDIGPLFDGAAPRPRATDADRDAVFRATHAAWVQTVAERRKRRTRRVFVGSAIAASLVLMLALTQLTETVPAPTVTVATIDAVRGDVMIGSTSDPVWRPIPVGRHALVAGSKLRTLEGSTRLVIGNQGSLRLDSNSVIAFVAPGTVDLEQGRLYFDSGPLHASIKVKTPLGTVRNDGTRFQIIIEDQAVSVAVRSGRAIIADPTGREIATEAKQQRRFFRDGRESQHSPLASDDDSWTWADALAPGFALDGRSAFAYLEWIAAETGQRLRFASREAEQRAQSEIYHGGAGTASTSTSDLAGAMRSARLDATMSNGVLLVSIL